MDKKVSTTSTKTEILNAYTELLDKMNESKQDNPKTEQEKKIKESTVASASALSDEKIIGQISSLKLAVNSSLDKIEDDLAGEYQKLVKIKEAISIEEQRLNDYYQINAGADSLAVILAAQKEKKAEFENEMATQRSTFEEEMKINKVKWEKEGKEAEEKRKELEDSIKKQRVREEEEYLYNLQLTRKKDKDQYEQKKASLEKDLAEKQDLFENEIKSREQAVMMTENELKELRTKVEKFPAELELAVQAALKETNARLDRDYKFEKQLSTKEHESEIKLKSQQLESLQLRIKDLEVQLKQAQAKVESSELNTKEITLKAIESSGQIKFVEKTRDEIKDSAK
jgi:hypothetical protein